MLGRTSVAKRVRRAEGSPPALAVLLALVAIFVGPRGSSTACQGQPESEKKPALTVRAIRPDKTTIKVGEAVRVAFEVETPASWHFYPAAKKPLLGKQTLFEFDQAEVAGPIEEPRPKYHRSGVIETDYHEGEVTITVPIRLKPGAKEGPFELKGRIVYQICDLNVCLNNLTPFQFTLTVLAAH